MSKGSAILAVGHGLADATPALTSLVAQIGEALLAIGWAVRRLSPLAGERDGADRASWKRCVTEIAKDDGPTLGRIARTFAEGKDVPHVDLKNLDGLGAETRQVLARKLAVPRGATRRRGRHPEPAGNKAIRTAPTYWLQKTGWTWTFWPVCGASTIRPLPM